MIINLRSGKLNFAVKTRNLAFTAIFGKMLHQFFFAAKFQRVAALSWTR